jgi:hypothetical protein
MLLFLHFYWYGLFLRVIYRSAKNGISDKEASRLTGGGKKQLQDAIEEKNEIAK